MADSLVIRGAREHNLRNVEPRAAARQAHRVHRAVGLGEVVAGLRHDLRRGPAALRRVAVGLRPAVPRPDGQARRRLHRGPVAGHLDRPEERLAQPAVDGRHDHRGLRLPAPAVRPHRRRPLPRMRGRGHPADAAADRRPHHGAARRHPVPGAGAGRARAQGHLRDAARRPGRAGVHAGAGRRRGPRDVRQDRARPLRAAHHRGHRRPARAARRHRAPAHRVARDRAEAGRRRGRGADRAAQRQRRRPHPRRGRGRPGRPFGPRRRRTRQRRRRRARDAHVQPAPGLPQRARQLRRAGAPQLLVQLAVRRLRDVRRPRHPLRGRPRAHRPRPDPQPRGRRHRAVGRRSPALLPAPGRRRGRRAGHRHGRAVLVAHRQAAPGGAVRQGRRQGVGAVQEPLRPRAHLQRQLRGRDPVPAAPARRGRERQRPRAGRGLHARGAVQRLRRRPAQAAVAGGHDRRLHRSPTSATCRSARRPRRWPPSSCPSATGSSPSAS